MSTKFPFILYIITAIIVYSQALTIGVPWGILCAAMVNVAIGCYLVWDSDGYYRGMREGFTQASDAYFKSRRKERESTYCLKCRQEEVEKNMDPK